jgi:hypothetical protein
MSVGSRNLQKRVDISNGRDKLRYEGQKLRFKFDLPRLEFRDTLKHVSYIVARSRINASSRKTNLSTSLQDERIPHRRTSANLSLLLRLQRRILQMMSLIRRLLSTTLL